jgi:hypothetical protein
MPNKVVPEAGGNKNACGAFSLLRDRRPWGYGLRNKPGIKTGTGKTITRFPAPVRQRVLVIGGGIAGMQAANYGQPERA